MYWLPRTNPPRALTSQQLRYPGTSKWSSHDLFTALQTFLLIFIPRGPWWLLRFLDEIDRLDDFVGETTLSCTEHASQKTMYSALHIRVQCKTYVTNVCQYLQDYTKNLIVYIFKFQFYISIFNIVLTKVHISHFDFFSLNKLLFCSTKNWRFGILFVHVFVWFFYIIKLAMIKK